MSTLLRAICDCLPSESGFVEAIGVKLRFAAPLFTVILSVCFAVPSMTLLSAHPGMFSENARQDTQTNAKDNFRIKMNVDLVPIDAVVRDRANAYVGRLAAENFAVYDNGVKQPLSHFSQGQEPLAVALIIDCSPSVKVWLADLKQAALSALELLKPEDKIVLFAFDQCPTQLTDLTSDHARIIQGLEEVKVGPQTNYYEAVLAAARLLKYKAPDYRRALLIISDNYSSRFQIKEQEVIRELQDASITLVGIRTPGDNKGAAISPDDIERLAKETGGEVLALDEERFLVAALEDAILNLKNRYHLMIALSNKESDASFHRLELKIEPEQSCSDCRVLARKGYYAGFRRLVAGDGNARGITSHLSCSGHLPETYVRDAMSAAARASEEPGSISFEARTSTTKGAAGEQQIQIDLLVDPAAIRFNRIDDQFTASLRLLFQWIDARKTPGEQWESIDLRLDPEAYRNLLRSGIPFSSTIRPKVWPQSVRAVVFDPGSNEFGLRVLKMAAGSLARAMTPEPPAAEPAQASAVPHPATPRLEQTQIPTIKVDVRQVLVPVVVTDVRGHTVPELEKGDFKVFEDGVQQQIIAVSTEADGADRLFAPTGSSEGQSSLPLKRAPLPAGKSPNRVCLIVVDTLNSDFGNFSAVRGALKKMFREEKPGSMTYGLVTLGLEVKVIQPWTTDSAALMRAVDNKAFGKAILQSERSNLAFQEEQLVRMLLSYCEKNPCPSKTGPSPHDMDLMAIRSFAATSSELRLAKMRVYFRQLRDLVASLGEMPGKRMLVLLSDGFAVHPGRDLFELIGMYVGMSKIFMSPVVALNAEMRDVLRVAQQRDTSFYTIDSRGLYVTPAGDDVSVADVRSMRSALPNLPQRHQQRETLAAQKSDGLRELASQTGGLFFENNNDIFAGLRRAVEDGRAYYLLSYVPSNPEADGKFRKIQIEVRGKQVTIRSKPGYWAPAK
jgi:VWFA-related protein